jgi:two-component system, sensor histidine kinase LadS
MTTTCFRHYLFLLLISPFVHSLISEASPALDTIKLREFNERITVVDKGVIVSTSEIWQPQQAWEAILNGKPGNPSTIYVGFTKEIYWLGFVVTNLSDSALATSLEVDNPQIDSLSFFQIDSDGIPNLLLLTGDKLLFSKRLVNHRNYVLPLHLKPGETKSILLKIDKRNSSLNFRVFLWPKEKFHEHNYRANLGFGVGFGFILLCLIYALFAFAFLRKAVYGWYALWILSNALYLFTALGFSFQYMYPGALDINSYFRVYIEVVILLCFAKFAQRFLNLADFAPVINKTVNYILWVFSGLAFTSIFAIEFFIRNAYWFLPIVNLLLLTGGFLTVIGAARTYKRQKASVIFFFTAFSFLLISYTIVTLSEFGWKIGTELSVNLVLIGIVIEVFIFSIALTYQMRKIQLERNQLLANITKVQKDILRAYVEGVEKERERISRELHDDIGSRLGSLKRFLSTTQTTLLEKQIDTLYEDVRALSHDLTAPSLKLVGLQQNILDFAYDTQQKSSVKISVQFYDFPEDLKVEISHQLFRIVQEAVNNAIKHGNVGEIDIQFFCHENELVLTIEDNGLGFDTTKNFRGIGIKNMRARVEAINGIFDMTSSPGKGTSILINAILP